MGGIAHALRETREIPELSPPVSGTNTVAQALYTELGFARPSSTVGDRKPPVETV